MLKAEFKRLVRERSMLIPWLILSVGVFVTPYLCDLVRVVS